MIKKAVLFIFCLISLAACNKSAGPSAELATPTNGDAISLVPISLVDWQKKLASYEPDIVVVDMWATWCESCIERFPKMIELHKRFRDQGVRFVSMNLDNRDDKPALELATRFLNQKSAEFENYLMNENLMQAFEMLDLKSIPVVLIYDRTGEERYRLTGDNPNNQFTDEDVEAAILALLSQPG